MEINIKETHRTMRTEKLPRVSLIAPTILGFYLMMKELGYSHSAAKIVLVLSANLKTRQMSLRSKTQPNQLDLFDKEWLNVDDKKALSVQFNFKYKDFLPKGSKNNNQVKNGLDELAEKSWTICFEKEVDGKIKKFQLKSALITTYLAEEGNGFKLVMNNYWYRAFINVADSFNPFDTDIIYDLSYNASIFYMYLKSLPLIKEAQYTEIMGKNAGLVFGQKGTRVKIEKIMKMLKCNYIYESDIRRKVLDPIIAELDAKTDLSAGYRFDNGCLCIATYSPLKNDIAKKYINVEEAKIKSAINYKVKNNLLNGTQASMMLEVYLKYTYEVVFNATQRKTILKGLKGQEYCDAFTKLASEGFSKVKDVLLYEDIATMRNNLRKRWTAV